MTKLTKPHTPAALRKLARRKGYTLEPERCQIVCLPDMTHWGDTLPYIELRWFKEHADNGMVAAHAALSALPDKKGER